MTLPTDPHAVIVGAGPIGLAAGISARRRGLEPLIIDAGVICNSIADYPIGMQFFTTSERLEIGGHPLSCTGTKATREEALAYYRGVVRAEGLEVRTGVRLIGVRGTDGMHELRLQTRAGEQTIRTPRVVLATGYFDHPNLLGIPGESLPHVHHRFVEPHRLVGLDVVVVGGKNSAVESALQAWRAGARVTLVHRGAELGRSVKYWLRPDLENRVAAGEIRMEFDARLTAISDRDVTMQQRGSETRLDADQVFLLTGYHPDFALLASIGIAMEPGSGRAVVNPVTLECSVPGIHLAGSVASGHHTGEVFIENGRYDGEKIFGDPASRERADELYAASPRPVGE